MPPNPSYLIEADPGKDYMRLTFSGLMDHPTTDRFEQELAAAFAVVPSQEGGPSDWLFLADLRDAGVQSRDIAERLQSIIAHYGTLTRRIAMLMSGSALELMQARRVANPDRTAFFRTEGDATAWLFDDRTSVAAPA